MIYFDKQTLKLLRYIKKSKNKGVSWDELRNKFGRDLANIFLLESLSAELYTVTKDQNENWIDFNNWVNIHLQVSVLLPLQKQMK